VIIGAAVLLLSLPLGSVKERYGGWDRYVIWPRSGAPVPVQVRQRGRAA
jgi:hypothetical protein